MTTSTTSMTVSFHGDTINLVSYLNNPYVAVKPITTNLGLDWPTQYTKLMEKYASTVGLSPTVEGEISDKSIPILIELPVVGEDGKQRLMLCLHLRKIPAWMYSIQLNRVDDVLRPKVMAYQEECDDVLWSYWFKGRAINPRLQKADLTVNESISLSKECVKLLKDVAESTNNVLATELYKHLQRMSAALGETVAPLAQLASGLRQTDWVEGGAA